MVTADIGEVVRNLQVEGIKTECLENWHELGLRAIMLSTGSEATYLLEPVNGLRCQISRISEMQPYYGEYRMQGSQPFIRRQGNPDRHLRLGNPVNILGLSRKDTEFDPDSTYTTTPLLEIAYLES